MISRSQPFKFLIKNISTMNIRQYKVQVINSNLINVKE